MLQLEFSPRKMCLRINISHHPHGTRCLFLNRISFAIFPSSCAFRQSNMVSDSFYSGFGLFVISLTFNFVSSRLLFKVLSWGFAGPLPWWTQWSWGSTGIWFWQYAYPISEGAIAYSSKASLDLMANRACSQVDFVQRVHFRVIKIFRWISMWESIETI